MRLVRVQVPEFRALKDVDITFEPNFYPQVFPLGSLNGGGKSTLLQLIFVLLNLEPDFSRKNIPMLEDSYFNDMLLKLIDKYSLKEELIKFATIILLINDNIELRLDYLYGAFYSLSDYLEKNEYTIKPIDGYIFYKNGESAIVVLASIDNTNIAEDQIKVTQLIKSIKKTYIFNITIKSKLYFCNPRRKTVTIHIR